jgi:hypothetical protein
MYIHIGVKFIFRATVLLYYQDPKSNLYQSPPLYKPGYIISTLCRQPYARNVFCMYVSISHWGGKQNLVTFELRNGLRH